MQTSGEEVRYFNCRSYRNANHQWIRCRCWKRRRVFGSSCNERLCMVSFLIKFADTILQCTKTLIKTIGHWSGLFERICNRKGRISISTPYCHWLQSLSTRKKIFWKLNSIWYKEHLRPASTERILAGQRRELCSLLAWSLQKQKTCSGFLPPASDAIPTILQ